MMASVLVRKEESERKEGFQQLLEGLRAFSAELGKTSGPLFLADEQVRSEICLEKSPFIITHKT